MLFSLIVVIVSLCMLHIYSFFKNIKRYNIFTFIKNIKIYGSVQFSRSVMSDSL